MKLEEVPSGGRVFVDANIFIYHFTRLSSECRTFLARCELGEIQAFTGAHILLEVLHRLMMLEALHKGLIVGGQPARKLKEHPEIVRNLHDYNQSVRQIPRMGVRIWAVTSALITASEVYLCEPTSLLTRAEEAERLGRVHNLPYISEVLAQVMKGVAWLRAGRLMEGTSQLRNAIEAFNAPGGKLWMPHYRAILAEGSALGGDLASGLQLIEESLTQIERTGWEERWYLAEILRLKGWMLSLLGDLAGAEENYQASLDWAREQQAKSWELRTATSLARLWQQQDKVTEAHRLLSEIYNWFTEGFGTQDLKDAKALLDELASFSVGA